MATSASTPKESILKLLKTIIDPETGINIVDMGLIYEVAPSEEGVFIKMGMTSAACPLPAPRRFPSGSALLPLG